MTEPATEFDPETTPTVTLAGKMWPVPVLAWKQLQYCRMEFLELTASINAAIAASDDAVEVSGDKKRESEDARGIRHMGVLAEVLNGLSNGDFGRLVIIPLHSAVSALHPSVTRDEFAEWPITEGERQLAWLTARRQSGLFVMSGEAPPKGETKGAA